MRRFFILPVALAVLFAVGCNDDQVWTPNQQINRIDNLIRDYPATPADFEGFVNDILAGVWDIDDWIVYRHSDIWNSSYYGYDNIGFGRGSQFLDLLFYPNGECHQCYLYAPAPYNNVPYPFLYTTLEWSYDTPSCTITLTNPEYLAEGSQSATTTLRLRYYRYGAFIMDGLQPSDEPLTSFIIRYVGQVDGAASRADYEFKFKDETIYSSLNSSTFR